jgi:hypothetical protein
MFRSFAYFVFTDFRCFNNSAKTSNSPSAPRLLSGKSKTRFSRLEVITKKTTRIDIHTPLFPWAVSQPYHQCHLWWILDTRAQRRQVIRHTKDKAEGLQQVGMVLGRGREDILLVPVVGINEGNVLHMADYPFFLLFILEVIRICLGE